MMAFIHTLEKLKKQHGLNTAFMRSLFVFITIAPFSTTATHAHAAQKPTKEVLKVEMSAAVCRLNFFSKNKTRQCADGHPITIKGYDIGYDRYCSSNTAFKLSPLQQKLVARYIPDKKTQKRIWQTYGKCSSLTANEYFRQLNRRAKNLTLPKELSSGNNYRVNKTRFMQQLLSSNKNMSPNNIDLICKNNSKNQAVLAQINFCYKNGKYSACDKKVDNCPKNFLIYGH